jgi:hypothetical protein
MLPTQLMWQKTITISDEKTAGLLCHGKQTINLLAPFLGKESTTKNASLESGIKLNVMAYWVHKFYDSGILIRTKTDKRRGSPIHFYRAIADEFLVPTDLLPSASDQELMEQVQQLEYSLFTSNIVRQGRKFSSNWYLHYYCTNGVQHWTFHPVENTQPRTTYERPIHDWSHLELAPAAYQALHQELWAIMEKYQALNGLGTQRQRYTLHLGLVERS